MDRREFLLTGAAFAASTAFSEFAPKDRYAQLQAEIDLVRASTFGQYRGAFRPQLLQDFAALQRLENAFDQVVREVRETTVTDKPAVWFLYNMGVVVKTPETCFAIDLMHRRGRELAPLLDFALITHNHSDHYTPEFYQAMNGAGKTVISNFLDNYGVKNWNMDGGYTRVPKTFKIKDVVIKTGLTDHNGYLVDFTSAYEIMSHGFTIYHSGDCSNVGKLNPSVTPDLWFVHPYCGLKVEDGVKKFHPKQTVIAHLNELGHDVNRWRWTWKDGLKAKASVEKAGGAAVVPTWGERIV